MIFDVSYWTRVGRRILYVALILIGLYIALKLSLFYMPFLIAFIISLIIEPAIKYIMKTLNMNYFLNDYILAILCLWLLLVSLYSYMKRKNCII